MDDEEVQKLLLSKKVPATISLREGIKKFCKENNLTIGYLAELGLRTLIVKRKENRRINTLEDKVCSLDKKLALMTQKDRLG